MTSGSSNFWYSNYTNISVNLVKWNTHNFSEFCAGWNGNIGAVWIDRNGEGDFDDTGEKVLELTS